MLTSIKIDLNSNLFINDQWITINKENKLEAIKLNVNNFHKDKIHINNKLDSNYALQAKIIDEKIKLLDDDEEIDADDEDDVQLLQNYIYSPETKYTNINNQILYDEDNELNSQDIEPYYDITGNPELSEFELDLSLYEFYYFKTDENDLQYYTSIVNDNPIYRISYYEKDNIIKLNLIGYLIRTFKIQIDDDKINFQLITRDQF